METEEDKRKSEVYNETLKFLHFRLKNPTLSMVEAMTLWKEKLKEPEFEVGNLRS